MPHDPKKLQAIVEDAAPPDMELAFKAMFGGILAYVDGRPMASLSDVGLAFKLTGAGHAELSALPGAKALQYEPGQPVSKTYVVVPEAMLKDRDALRGWIVRTAASVKAAPVKTPAKKKAKE